MFAWVVASTLIVGAPGSKDKPANQDLYCEWESDDPVDDSDGTRGCRQAAELPGHRHGPPGDPPPSLIDVAASSRNDRQHLT
jgi:hypothetical protein